MSAWEEQLDCLEDKLLDLKDRFVELKKQKKISEINQLLAELYKKEVRARVKHLKRKSLTQKRKREIQEELEEWDWLPTFEEEQQKWEVEQLS